MRNFSPLAKGNLLALGYYISGGRKYRRYMARNGKIQGMIFHHIVGGIDSLQRELLKTHRTLSVNYGIAVDGTIHGCVSERFKANTSSHAADHTHITVETANELLAPSYKISDRSFDAAARLAADCAKEYGFVPSRQTIRFHREFYATACPGPDFWARRNDFVALVRRYYYGAVPADPKPPVTKPSAPADGSLPAAGVAMLGGVGIGDWVAIRNWALFSDPGFRTGKRFVTGEYKIVGISYKYRGGVEPSLLLQGHNGTRGWAHYSAVRGRIDSPKGTPAPRPTQPKRLSVSEMASEILAGKHGTGHANRQRSLGIDAATYAKVRAEVNRRI